MNSHFITDVDHGNEKLSGGLIQNNGVTTDNGGHNGFSSTNGAQTEPNDAKDDPVICKLKPFNLCYRFDGNGIMHPLGGRRPVRLIRVYSG